MKKISRTNQILLIIASLAILVMLKVPIWKIMLVAPQYPEGLEMKIWHNTLSGDVEIISRLNHYIGMRTISVEMFPEFTFLGKVIIGVAIICLLLAIIGRLWSAVAHYVVLAVADSLAMYDFWKWGYDYGHNLDPTAPIVVPGMAYQPPLIGYKQLLNFEAWSVPDIGGWVLMGVTTVSLGVLIFEWWKTRREKKAATTTSKSTVLENGSRAKTPAAMLLGLAFFLGSGCTKSGPDPINWGKDNCDNCRMTLSDRHFGCEVLTKKGKAFKFDDLNCMRAFLQKGTVKTEEIFGKYVVDHATSGQLIPAETAVYLFSEKINSPMGAGVAAFANQAEMEKVKAALGGEMLDFQNVMEKM